MEYNQLSQEHKVGFYNDLCETPFSGDPNSIVQATAALLKASGWSNDEINDNFKGYVEEHGLADGTPAKCTIDLGLEEAPPSAPEAAPAGPTPPKRGRKKASVPAAAAGEPASQFTPGVDAAPVAEGEEPKKKRGGQLIPRQPRVAEDQKLYPGLGKVSGIRQQFKNLAGPDGCTLAELISRYEVSGVSTAAKNKDSASSFVRGYVNNGLRPDVDLFRLEPVTEEQRQAAATAQPVSTPAPESTPSVAAASDQAQQSV